MQTRRPRVAGRSQPRPISPSRVASCRSAGKGIPAAVRMLLLTLAIVDDIAAILVIAFFYSSGIALYGLLIVAAGILIVLGMQRLRIALAWAYVVPGAVVWFGMLCAGVHPTLAGVLLGLLTPAACGADGSSAL